MFRLKIKRWYGVCTKITCKLTWLITHTHTRAYNIYEMFKYPSPRRRPLVIDVFTPYLYIYIYKYVLGHLPSGNVLFLLTRRHCTVLYTERISEIEGWGRIEVGRKVFFFQLSFGNAGTKKLTYRFLFDSSTNLTSYAMCAVACRVFFENENPWGRA